ncbi:MAG: response regulator [Thermodesulfobacteriota bacterium]|nr:response regulator [Thermodesulfobacteriota bacterium]
MSKKILIVDDEDEMISFLSAFLEDNGFKVTSAYDGDQALKMLEREKPDLVTLDIMMPNKSGLKVFKVMRESEAHKNIPIIIVTGFHREANPLVDFKKFIYSRKIKQPEGFIEKPIDKAVLLSAVNKALK